MVHTILKEGGTMVVWTWPMTGQHGVVKSLPESSGSGPGEDFKDWRTG